MEHSVIMRGMSHDGSARITVINSTDIVNSAIEKHHTAPTATAALGRLLTAASMIGSMLGGKNDSVTVSLRGDGEGGHIMAVSDYFGNVRGYIEKPNADPPRRADGHLNVAAVVGGGILYVIKDIEGMKEPQSGTVEIRSGEIAEDIAAYFAESEQIPTVCALGVLVSSDGSCRSAGGVLIQLLPFASEETVCKIEKNVKNLTNLSSLFDKGLTDREIADIAFSDIPYDVFDERDVEYKCNCSRKRTQDGIRRLGREEILKLFDEQEAEGKPRELEVVCRFCNTRYVFHEKDLL